jgi:hypothetical protein
MQPNRPLVIFSVMAGIVCFLVILHDNLSNAEIVFAFGAPNHDLYHYYLPLLTFSRESILSGSFPLWNPYQACGHPFFATLQYAPLYPINWMVFLFDDIHLSILVIQAADVSIGMIGVILYLRHLKADWPAIIPAAALFGYCVFLQTYTLPVGATLCWLPIIMWLSHRLFDKPGFGRCAALSASLVVCFLAGFPQFFIYICIMTFAYFSAIVLMHHGIHDYRVMVSKWSLFLLAFGLTAGLACVQLFPTLELAQHSVRQLDSTYEQRLFTRLTLEYVFSYFRREVDFGFSLLLVPFAFASSKYRKIAIALLSVSGLSLLVLALKVMSLEIPILDAFRFPHRILLMNQFFAAALIGIGLASFWEQAPLKLHDAETGKWNWFWPITLAYAFVLLYLIGKDSLAPIFRSHGYLLLVSLFLFIGCGIVLYRSGFSPRAKRVGAGAGVLLLMLGIGLYGNAVSLPGYLIVLITSILLAGLVLANASLVPGWARRLIICVVALFILLDARIVEYFPVPGTSKSTLPDVIAQRKDWIEENAGYSRVVAWKKYLHNTASISRTFDIDHYEPLALLRWRNYVRFVVGPAEFDKTTDYLRPFYGKPSRYGLRLLQHSELLGLCSLRYLIATGLEPQKMKAIRARSWRPIPQANLQGSTSQTFENRHALPRAYLVNSYMLTGTEEESLQAIGDNISELSHSVILENGSPSFPSASKSTTPGSVRITEYGINEVKLHVEPEEPSILVLTDSYYPGWIALVDGEERPIWRANSLFRGLEVPAGDHRVVFKYRPYWFYLGATVSLVTLLLIVAGVLVEAYRSRKERSIQAEERSAGANSDE